METDPILHELDGLSPELARLKRASREAQAPAGDSVVGGQGAAEDFQRMAKLRAGILARTTGEAMEAAPTPFIHPTQAAPTQAAPTQAAPTQAVPTRGRLRTMFPRALAAAAVLTAALVGAWFALKPTATPCDTILCALDEMSDAELAGLLGNTITWSSTSDWGMGDTEELADAALEAGWLDNLTSTDETDPDEWISTTVNTSDLTSDDLTWENASLDELAAFGEGLSDEEWDAILLGSDTDSPTP